ncbi:MICOS complex subunit MIC27 [Pleuronectes platessa]|uniref:MICOS complex subunit MIC27 n=1 Tax=Pleuronectes platessa TaxID=8262 RepID=UPI00232A63A2|nr:MICOS complex subunit MIC27 [Pleuronectes platessa]
MAAKVVMVAVPAVLGIASIRVYTVSEAPAGGLVTREKLNIYTPLSQSAEVQFVPESPGVIESGLTAARESILPFALAVKGSCVSVKRQSVNLYHSGQDVFYYLKDPPPGFLPRLGTITMAGLLGMFLARKGSRFKRVAVPLGLMSAGVSVCYPAQAVAVIKVTGRKVYAAGQWSSAAVSSLLTPKPQEPVAKEISASQPESATVSSPESAVVEALEVSSDTDISSSQSATIPETEVESAESVPSSDEPITAVITKEASSVTLTEISPDEAPTETNTDPVVQLVPAETEAAPPSEELPASVENEAPSNTKQAPDEVSNEASPAESTGSIEPETGEAVPVQSAEGEVASSSEELLVPVESIEASDTKQAPEDVSNEASPDESTGSVEPETEEAFPVQSAEGEVASSSEELLAPVESKEPSDTKQAPEDVSNEASPDEATASVEPETVEAAPVQSAEVEADPSTEEPPVLQASDEPAGPVIESAEPESAAQPEVADQFAAAAVEETPPPPEQPAADPSKGGSGFKPDPSLMDFGQSSPEDEDLYSTRS